MFLNRAPIDSTLEDAIGTKYTLKGYKFLSVNGGEIEKFVMAKEHTSEDLFLFDMDGYFLGPASDPDFESRNGEGIAEYYNLHIRTVTTTYTKT